MSDISHISQSVGVGIFYNINHNPMYMDYMEDINTIDTLDASDCNKNNKNTTTLIYRENIANLPNIAMEPTIPLKLNDNEPCESIPKYINISNTYINTKQFEQNDKSDLRYKVLDLYFKYKGDRNKIRENFQGDDENDQNIQNIENLIETVHSQYLKIEPRIKKMIKDHEYDVNRYDLFSDFLFFHCKESDFCLWMESHTSLNSMKIRFLANELRDFFSILDLKKIKK